MSDHEAASGQRETAETIRVVIVDDHQIFRTGLRAELGPSLTWWAKQQRSTRRSR